MVRDPAPVQVQQYFQGLHFFHLAQLNQHRYDVKKQDSQVVLAKNLSFFWLALYSDQVVVSHLASVNYQRGEDYKSTDDK